MIRSTPSHRSRPALTRALLLTLLLGATLFAAQLLTTRTVLAQPGTAPATETPATPTPAADAATASSPTAPSTASQPPGDGPQPVVATPEKSDGAPAKVARGVPTDPEGILVVMSYWMAPFILASVVGVWIVFERMVVLRRRRVIPHVFVTQFMEALQAGKLDAKSAISACEKNGSPVAAVFEHAVRKWGRSSVEIEQAVLDGGERQVGHLRRHLRELNGVSTLSPLVGLFGTVVGMIQSFNQIAKSAAMGNSEILAEGIGIALLTTAFGLTIAIPASVMHLYFTGRVDLLVSEIDELAQKVVWLIADDSEAAQTPAGASRPKQRSNASGGIEPPSRASR